MLDLQDEDSTKDETDSKHESVVGEDEDNEPGPPLDPEAAEMSSHNLSMQNSFFCKNILSSLVSSILKYNHVVLPGPLHLVIKK